MQGTKSEQGATTTLLSATDARMGEVQAIVKYEMFGRQACARTAVYGCNYSME
jgi:hypothetical protein